MRNVFSLLMLGLTAGGLSAAAPPADLSRLPEKVKECLTRAHAAWQAADRAARKGQMAEAVRLGEAALAAERAILGMQPRTAAMSWFLGSWNEQAERWPAAVRAREEVIALLVRL